MPSPIPAYEDMDLAMRIRVLAAVRNLSLVAIAEAAGLSHATVHKAAQGGNPSLDTARRLATAFEFAHIEDLVP